MLFASMQTFDADVHKTIPFRMTTSPDKYAIQQHDLAREEKTTITVEMT